MNANEIRKSLERRRERNKKRTRGTQERVFGTWHDSAGPATKLVWAAQGRERGFRIETKRDSNWLAAWTLAGDSYS